MSPFASLYDRGVGDLLDGDVEETWVETRAGRTHVLLSGPADAPPVVVFQGGNVTNPVTLAWVQGLADEYRLVAPDTPGEPGVAVTVAPDDYGQWVVDVLDALDHERVAVVGISHGAGVALEAAVAAPDRLVAAVLVVPAGFGTPLTSALARVVAPSLAYRVVPSQRLLHAALAPLFTQPVASIPAVVTETVGLALRTSDLQAEFPGPDGAAALAAFDAPVLVVAAEHDPFFPADWLVDRARAWLPSLVEPVTLEGERHFLSPRGQLQVTDCSRSFLATNYVTED